MKAILWDGNKKLNGELILMSDIISFDLVDFAESDLSFKIKYAEISTIQYVKVYGIISQGISINTSFSSNIFIVEDSEELKSALDQKLKY
jgi:hypothetical protein